MLSLCSQTSVDLSHINWMCVFFTGIYRAKLKPLLFWQWCVQLGVISTIRGNLLQDMEFLPSAEFCFEKQQLYQRYKSEVVGASMCERQSAGAQLIDPVTHFLCDVEPKLRFSSTIQHVFSINARTDPMWNLTAAARTFRHFENYALNLLTFPWKREFWTVRVSYFNYLSFLIFSIPWVMTDV